MEDELKSCPGCGKVGMETPKRMRSVFGSSRQLYGCVHCGLYSMTTDAWNALPRTGAISQVYAEEELGREEDARPATKAFARQVRPRERRSPAVTDNEIATALIASMRRAGVLGRRRVNTSETIEAVDRHLESCLDYRVAFETAPEQRTFMRRQDKRIRNVVFAKLGIGSQRKVEA